LVKGNKTYFVDKDVSGEIVRRKNSVTQERVNLIASHMFKQYKEHQQATSNTTQMFYRILNDMREVTDYLRQSFSARGVESSKIFCEIDADRSVGIINILWHSISFTTRGNTKPQALYRENESPLFTGRILALNGDFQDASLDIQDQEYPDILRCEIASLYVPADTTSPAILKIKHIGNKEFKINQIDASKEFLLKVIEIICGGGIYHENEPDSEDE
jgi:hypothetical protein